MNQETTRLHSIWVDVKRRCCDSRRKGYQRYGGRGITICPEWGNDFEAFRSWAMSHGYNDDLSLDRKDVNGHYEPGNCRWATPTEQARNRRDNRNVTMNGVTLPLHAWATRLGISDSTVWNRHVNLGKSAEETLKVGSLCPPKLVPEQYLEIIRRREMGQSLKSIGRDLGCSAQTVMRMLRKAG